MNMVSSRWSWVPQYQREKAYTHAPSLSAKREYNAFGEGCSVVRSVTPDQTYASTLRPIQESTTYTIRGAQDLGRVKNLKMSLNLAQGMVPANRDLQV
jgi:hypothetical protein